MCLSFDLLHTTNGDAMDRMYRSTVALRIVTYRYTLCFKQNVTSNVLQQLYQLLTDFENSVTVGNSNELSANRHMLIFLPPLKTSL